MIRVLLADDQALVRAGFRALLDAQDDIEVAGEAADGVEAVAMAAAMVPDVVLMDIRMPHRDGLTAAREIIADDRLQGVRVVMLTTFDLDEYVFEALRIGASGFLVKDTDPAELIAGVRAVARGDALLSPGVTRRLIAEFAIRAREEIAALLVVSPATAKTHVSRAMVKLHARDRAQLVVYAYESGLVQPGQLRPGPPS